MLFYCFFCFCFCFGFIHCVLLQLKNDATKSVRKNPINFQFKIYFQIFDIKRNVVFVSLWSSKWDICFTRKDVWNCDENTFSQGNSYIELIAIEVHIVRYTHTEHTYWQKPGRKSARARQQQTNDIYSISRTLSQSSYLAKQWSDARILSSLFKSHRCEWASACMWVGVCTSESMEHISAHDVQIQALWNYAILNRP